MHAKSIFSKSVVILVSLALFSSVFVGIVSNEGIPDNTNNTEVEQDIRTEAPKSPGTRAGSPRNVLAEYFTSWDCTFCANGDPSIDQLGDQYGGQLNVIIYHVWWPGGGDDPYYNDNIPDNTDRANYYAVSSEGVPYLKTDGTLKRVGAGSPASSYSNYKTDFDSRLPILSAFQITVSGRLDSGTGYVDAFIEATDTTPGVDVQVRLGVVEDNLYEDGGANGIDRHRFVMRDMLTEATLSGFMMGDTTWVNRTFSVNPGWNENNLQVVVFLQRDDTKEVLQSGFYDYIPQPILVVDDDESSQPVGSEDDYQERLCQMGYSFDSWVHNVVGDPTEADLAKYEAVIWLTGTTSSNTITASDQTAIANYMDNGKGSVFFVGENIGADIGGTAFYQNYLHANFVSDSTGANNVFGVAGDPISDAFSGMNLPIQTGSPSEVNPVAPATTIFKYTGSSKSAGIKAVHDADSRIAYFAYLYFEGSDSDSNKMLVMEKVLKWIIVEVNYLLIRDAAGDAGNIITNISMLGSDTITMWAAAYNDSIGFLGNYQITIWTEDKGGTIISITSPGSSTLVTALLNSGISVLTAEVWGLTVSADIWVNPPDVDYMQIRDAPWGGGVNLCDPANYPSFPVGHVTTFWAAAFNNTIGFVYDLETTWMSSDDTIVAVTTPGKSSIGTCSNTNDGSVIITAIESGMALMNSTTVTVLPPTADYIRIVDAPGGAGAEVTTKTYSPFDTDIFYAASFNQTAGYLTDISADWSSDTPSVGDVSPATGVSTTFTAKQVPIDQTCSVLAISGPMSHTTGLLTVLGPIIDEIRIVDAPGGAGNEVTTRTYGVDDTEVFYAAAFNDTSGYMADVSADWSCNIPSVGDVTPTTGTSTTFRALQVAADSTCTVTAIYNSIPGTTGILTVLAPVVDEVRIRDAAGGAGSEVTTASYIINENDVFYAAGYNASAGYLKDVSANWASDTPSVGDVSPATGLQTTFTAKQVPVDSTCTVSATYNSIVGTTGLLTVLAITIDEIKIRDAPGGGGVEIDILTFGVLDTLDLYAAAYNYTSGYLTDVNANWSSDAPLVGSVLPAAGISTTFTAQLVAVDSTCTVTAEYIGILDTTGLLTVLKPRVDGVQIRSASTNGGYEVTTEAFSVLQTFNLYAAGLNSTSGYVEDVPADWSSDATTVGDVAPKSSSQQTSFTAYEVSSDSTCTITATYLGYIGSSGLFTVLSPRVDYIRIEDTADGVGSEVDTASYAVMQTDYFYAAAYNYTVDYIFDVEAQWQSDNMSIGTVDLMGFSTMFTAQRLDENMTCTVSAGYGIFSDSTGLLTVYKPTVDYIRIVDEPLDQGSDVTTATYNAFDVDFFYAAAFNNTVSYLYDVDAQWKSNPTGVGDITSYQTGVQFKALGLLSDGACLITATFGSLGDSAGLLTVLAMPPLTVDYIVIMDSSGGTGNPVWEFAKWPGESYTYFSVGDTMTLWAAGFNASTGYFVDDVVCAWSTLDVLLSPDDQNATVTDSAEKSATLTIVTKVGGALFVRVENTNLGISNTTDMIVIIPPTVDHIEIRDAPDGGGNMVTTKNYIANQVDEFYAAAYNDTIGYIGDVLALWESDDSSVGTISSPGSLGTFTAQDVTSEGTCKVTATYGGHTCSTDLLYVVVPEINEIIIRDSENGEGGIVMTLYYDAEDTDTFYAAAYSDTLGYLFDVDAQWTIDPQNAGELVSSGNHVTFTAGTLSVNTPFTITATHGGVSNSTGTLMINAQVDSDAPEPPGQPVLEVLGPDSIKLTWTPSSDDDINKYIIKRAEDPDGPWKEIAEVEEDETSYTDKNLKPGTMYYYQVVAVDDSDNPSEATPWIGKNTPAEFPLLLFLLIIVIVSVILAVAVGAKKKKSNAIKRQEAAKAAQAKPKPRPPQKKTTTTKKEKPPPPPWMQNAKEKVKEKSEEEVEWHTEEEMPPPPPPPEA